MNTVECCREVRVVGRVGISGCCPAEVALGGAGVLTQVTNDFKHDICNV